MALFPQTSDPLGRIESRAPRTPRAPRAPGGGTPFSTPALSGTDGGSIFGNRPFQGAIPRGGDRGGRGGGEPGGDRGLPRLQNVSFTGDLRQRLEAAQKNRLRRLIQGFGVQDLVSQHILKGPPGQDHVVGFEDLKRILGSGILAGNQLGTVQDAFGRFNDMRFSSDILQNTNIGQLERISQALGTIDPSLLGTFFGGPEITRENLSAVNDQRAIQDAMERSFLRSVFGFAQPPQPTATPTPTGGSTTTTGGSQTYGPPKPPKPPDPPPAPAAGPGFDPAFGSGPFILRQGGVFGGPDSLEELLERLRAAL